MTDFLLYVGKLLLLTLGTVIGCGLAVRLCSWLFCRLSGRRSALIFDITSTIGTPIHELGHAIMCLIFGHKIQEVRLWIPPPHENGMAGYVSHQYNKRNLWQNLGNLFIGLGPILSGLAVVVLALYICFPTQWGDYLAQSRALIESNASAAEVSTSVLSLFQSIPAAFRANWWLSLIGLIVIFAVSMHIDLSPADIQNSAGAFPLYLILTVLIAIPTYLLKTSGSVVATLELFNLRMLSLFCVVIAFAVLWVLLALLIRLFKVVIGWF